MSNNSSKYLLSIVIPTKNRQKYCIEAVKQIISLKKSDIQIVIQDNSDDNTLFNQIKPYTEDGIVKYNYTAGAVSFVDNFGEALSLSDGEYICMIGDDDGVLPIIYDVTLLAKRKNYDCVISAMHTAVYIWPSDKPIVEGADNGYLCLSYINEKIKRINPEQGLRDLALNAGQDYLKLDLPRVYHGIAKKSRLDEIKKISGSYFGGLTPDIFNAIALAQVCNNVYRLHFPITVSGICPGSGSSNSASGKHTGDLKDAPHFVGHTDYCWDERIPAVYSVESIWAETTLKAFKTFKREDLYSLFNISRLDNICFKKYPQFSSIIKKHAKKYNITLKTTPFYFQRQKYIDLLKRIYNRIRHIRFGVKKFYNISSIAEAVRETDRVISTQFKIQLSD